MNQDIPVKKGEKDVDDSSLSRDAPTINDIYYESKQESSAENIVNQQTTRNKHSPTNNLSNGSSDEKFDEKSDTILHKNQIQINQQLETNEKNDKNCTSSTLPSLDIKKDDEVENRSDKCDEEEDEEEEEEEEEEDDDDDDDEESEQKKQKAKSIKTHFRELPYRKSAGVSMLRVKSNQSSYWSKFLTFFKKKKQEEIYYLSSIQTGPITAIAIIDIYIVTSSLDRTLQVFQRHINPRDHTEFYWERNFCLVGDNSSGMGGIWTIACCKVGCIPCVIAGDDEGKLHCWNLKTREKEFSEVVHNSFVYQVVIDEEKNLLASVGDDNLIKIWDISSFESSNNNTPTTTRYEISTHYTSIFSLAFCMNNCIVTNGKNEEKLYDIIIWNLENQEQIKKVNENDQIPYWYVAISPSGNHIYVSSYDKPNIRIFDVHGKFERELKNDEERGILQIIPKSDDYIITVGRDKKVKLWNLANEQKSNIKVLQEHSSWVRAAVIHYEQNSGDWIFAVGSDPSKIFLSKLDLEIK